MIYSIFNGWWNQMKLLIYWLIDYLTDWMIKWLNWLHDWMIDRFIEPTVIYVVTDTTKQLLTLASQRFSGSLWLKSAAIVGRIQFSPFRPSTAMFMRWSNPIFSIPSISYHPPAMVVSWSNPIFPIPAIQ